MNSASMEATPGVGLVLDKSTDVLAEGQERVTYWKDVEGLKPILLRCLNDTVKHGAGRRALTKNPTHRYVPASKITGDMLNAIIEQVRVAL